MTLTGFEHDKNVLNQKKRLHSAAKVEGVSAKKPSRRPSTEPAQKYQEAKSDQESSDSIQNASEHVDLPMNETVQSEKPSQCQSSEVRETPEDPLEHHAQDADV